MNASVHLSPWVLSSPLSVGVCVPGSQDRNVTGRTVQMDFADASGSLLFDYTIALTHDINLEGRCQYLPSLQALLQVAGESRGPEEMPCRSHSLHMSWDSWGLGGYFRGERVDCTAYRRISVPGLGIEPDAPAPQPAPKVRAWNPNH